MFKTRKEKPSFTGESWIEQLRPIISDFKDGDNKFLSFQDVERLSLIIRLKIDSEEGNISKYDLEIALNHGLTYH